MSLWRNVNKLVFLQSDFLDRRMLWFFVTPPVIARCIPRRNSEKKTRGAETGVTHVVAIGCDGCFSNRRFDGSCLDRLLDRDVAEVLHGAANLARVVVALRAVQDQPVLLVGFVQEGEDFFPLDSPRSRPQRRFLKLQGRSASATAAAPPHQTATARTRDSIQSRQPLAHHCR